MGTKSISLSEAMKTTGRSRRDLLNRLTDDEIRRRAERDPDNPILTDEELEELELAEPGRPKKPHYKNDTERSEGQSRKDELEKASGGCRSDTKDEKR